MMNRYAAAALGVLIAATGAPAQTNVQDDISGFWSAVEPGSGTRVELNIIKLADGRFVGHVAYLDNGTGELICRTPVRLAEGSGSTFAFRESQCGGAEIGLLYGGRTLYFERLAQTARGGPLTADLEFDLEYGGPPRRPAAPGVQR